MYDVIIIGKGPAGISASLYIKRANLSVLIIGKDEGALKKAQKVENYYGIVGSGEDILKAGEKQAIDLSIEILTEEVLSIDYNKNFIVTTTSKRNNTEYEAKSVIIATGVNRPLPYIKGLKEFENKGISYCAICDAFFYKGKNVAVLGSGQYALHEAKYLQNIANKVYILTNGQNNKLEIDDNIEICEDDIEEILGDDTIKAIKFKNNSEIQIDGLFIANGVASSVDLAKKIGAKTESNRIIVDEKMQTTIKGLYSAGDCTGGLLQISKAVYEGAKAGTEIIKFLKEEKI